jgi:hypothetical protein
VGAPLTPVILESPYAGNVEQHERYARAAMRDCFSRGEAPFASHLLYTQPGVLYDGDPADRQLGIEAGLVWGRFAACTVVYADFGISLGMRHGIERAKAEGRPVIERRLDPEIVAQTRFRRLAPQTLRNYVEALSVISPTHVEARLRDLEADNFDTSELRRLLTRGGFP